MINQQTPERVVGPTANTLDVFDIWPTIQGEGPLAGRRAVFVRLAGCNLQCPLCDTDYTSKRETLSLLDVLRKVDAVQSSPEANHQRRLMVVTGGEPLRQYLPGFIRAAVVRGWQVQIETNGSLVDEAYAAMTHDLHYLYTVVSPKTGAVPDTVWRAGNLAAKYVIEAGHVCEEDGLPTRALGYNRRPARPPKWWRGEVYVQPLDEPGQDNSKHLDAAVASVMRFGYRLSIQGHKLAGLK
jgi:organic radical activating enzyme